MFAKAPLRVSFIGGGTDLLPFAATEGGCVISAAIDAWVKVDPWKITLPFDDCSGLGSSCAISVAKVKLMFPDLPNYKLFKTAVEIEAIGQQDQAMAVYGGFRFLRLGDHVCYPQAIIPPLDFEKYLALVYLGKRTISASDILHEEINNLDFTALRISKALCYEAYDALVKQDIHNFTEVIKEGWEVKKCHSPHICTSLVQEAQEHYEKLGVWAFKLCGAGNGGYALLIKPPDMQIGIPIKIVYQGASCEV